MALISEITSTSAGRPDSKASSSDSRIFFGSVTRALKHPIFSAILEKLTLEKCQRSSSPGYLSYSLVI